MRWLLPQKSRAVRLTLSSCIRIGGKVPRGVGCAFLPPPAVLRSALLGQGELRAAARVVAFVRLEMRRG